MIRSIIRRIIGKPNPSSAASQLAKWGAEQRRLSLSERRARVHDELKSYVQAKRAQA